MGTIALFRLGSRAPSSTPSQDLRQLPKLSVSVNLAQASAAYEKGTAVRAADD